MTEKAPVKNEVSLEALKAGDKAELARMVELYSEPIYRLGLKMLGSEQDAEDVLQETFMKALRSIQQFEGRSSISTWLYRIAMNEIFLTLRKKKPMEESLDGYDSDSEEPEKPKEIIDWCCLPENELMNAEVRKTMSQAIEKLSPALRSVFILRDMNHLSVKETADALGISEAAVKTRLLRARLQLREDLSVYFSHKMP
ncbi:RNA polymerase sigma factor, sigma-70 family [Anaerolinea thermolimosa]|uniref:RNA polymerase sigma factor n=1 Tax=Anaerolinea thermolimosa TaxID=229919 RepID=UPI0007805D0F|nr:sigma-70 family RNA polymerase sigma factor [Anaerolinea thermolimosa]GAP06307.1 RNA polymerase sigma factor, sigma-70 family [Anaerolinea thermolimosa]